MTGRSSSVAPASRSASDAATPSDHERLMTRAGRHALAAIVAMGFLAGCGHGSTRPQGSSYAACRSPRAAAACLRFVGRAAHLTSIRVTTTVPPQVSGSCADAVRMTRLKVVCPPLIPAGGVVRDHDLYGPQIVDRGTYSAARLIGKLNYLGHLITIYRFPDNDGQLEGHDAAFATEHGVSYFVSIHGHTHDDGDIAMLLAILARSP
jgi:hypothetical protein